MSLKRLILLLVVLGAVATVIVSFAAGSGGNEKRHPKGTHQGPVQRSQPSNPNATEKYWTPDRMKRAKPLPIGIPGGRTQPDGSGGNGGSTAPAHR